MKHPNKYIVFSLGTISFLLFCLGILLSTTKNYTFVRSNQDVRTTYWQPSDGPCDETQRMAKRPNIKIDTAIGFYETALLGGGSTSSDTSSVSTWKLDQGNCPYQIMDIYESGLTYDLYAATAAFAGLSFYFVKKEKR